MKKLGIYLTLIFFILCLFSVPVLSALKKSDDYSIYENRSLASFPQFSQELLFSGHYSRAWENYLTDRIVGRNTMLQKFTFLEMNILKKAEINDVAVVGDVLLPFNEYVKTDTVAISQSIATITDELSALNKHILQNGGKFLYVSIPEQRSALRSLYPWYLNDDALYLDTVISTFSSGLNEKGVPHLDMKKEFGQDIANYYSKLDHHYTYKGAYFTYQSIAKALNMTPAKINIRELPNPFFGSRNRKLYNNFPTEEKLMIGFPESFVPFTRTDNGKKVSSTFFSYSEKDTDSPITYTAYMGGDIAETVIDTNRPALPNILLFGDSFTNPLESLLYLNANKLYVLDLRHYTEKSLYDYISQIKPDIVLCVRDDTNILVTEGNGTFR